MPKIRVAVLASGRGSDFQSIINGVQAGKVNAELVALITENPGANAVERARKHSIPFFIFDKRKYSDRLQYDREIKAKLDELKVDLVVLAGYMRLIKDEGWLNDYAGKMINIHPSLLPAFPGAHAPQDAFNAKAKVSGYTIHFVDASLDGGPILFQEQVDVSECKNSDEIAGKILAREHLGLPAIVDSFSKGTYKIQGKKVVYEKKE